MKKKLIIVLFSFFCALCLAFGLTACNKGTTTGGTTDNNTNNEQTDNTGDGSGDSGTSGGSSSSGDNTDDGGTSGGSTGGDDEQSGDTETGGTEQGDTEQSGDGETEENENSDGDADENEDEEKDLTPSEGLKYTLLSDNTYEVSGIGTCTDTDIVIPDAYNDLPVIAIGAYSFYGCSLLESISLPDSITSIGECAFYNCCNLTNLILSEGILFIGDDAFYNTGYYNTVNNWDNNVLYINTYLIKVRNLSDNYSIKDGTTVIGSFAFSGQTSLTVITIPDSIISINTHAFSGCIVLSEINFNAMSMEDLSSEDLVFYNAGTKGDGITVIIGANVTRIPANLFNGYYRYSSDYTPKIIKVIFEEFSKCESIGNRAFYYCVSLTSLNIPDSVAYIGEHAFLNCTSLTNVDIGSGVNYIGTQAFNYCSSLSNINVNINNTEYKSVDGDLYSDDGTKLIQYAIAKENTSFYIPENVSYIGIGAFANCITLMNISMPESMTYISSSAFSNCTALKSIIIPSNVSYIGYAAFNGCTSIEIISFQNTNGWYVTKTKDNISGIDVNVTNTSTNIKYFTDHNSYCEYYWHRIVN